MLTVQPKITNYAAQKAISFRASEDGFENRGEDFYKEKVDFYKQQSREFEQMSSDDSNPESLKKIMKGFRVASEALLEGWAVAWGTSKGSKILKSSVISGSQSKFFKSVKDVLRPIYRGLKASGKKFVEKFNKTIEHIKTSKFAEKFGKFVEDMRKNPIGKYIVAGAEYIGKAFKFVGKIVKAGFKKLAKPFKGKTKSEVYDKATKVASNTLGVGAGVAGAYNAATGADKRQNKESGDIDKMDMEDEYDDPYDEGDDI